MSSRGGSNAVMEPLQALPDRLQFKFGVEFRQPYQPPPPLESLLPVIYVRIQIASPPPDRIGGAPWSTGLRVFDKTVAGGSREFHANDPTWRQSGVFVEPHAQQLSRPDPKTLICDRWIAVRAVPPTKAATRTFTLTNGAGGQLSGAGPTNHFLTVPYTAPSPDGKPLELAGVHYYCEGVLPFTRELTAEEIYLGVSTEQFGAFAESGGAKRKSADYIVAVKQVNRSGLNEGQSPDPPHDLPFTINRW